MLLLADLFFREKACSPWARDLLVDRSVAKWLFASTVPEYASGKLLVICLG